MTLDSPCSTAMVASSEPPTISRKPSQAKCGVAKRQLSRIDEAK